MMHSALSSIVAHTTRITACRPLTLTRKRIPGAAWRADEKILLRRYIQRAEEIERRYDVTKPIRLSSDDLRLTTALFMRRKPGELDVVYGLMTDTVHVQTDNDDR